MYRIVFLAILVWAEKDAAIFDRVSYSVDTNSSLESPINLDNSNDNKENVSTVIEFATLDYNVTKVLNINSEFDTEKTILEALSMENEDFNNIGLDDEPEGTTQPDQVTEKYKEGVMTSYPKVNPKMDYELTTTEKDITNDTIMTIELDTEKTTSNPQLYGSQTLQENLSSTETPILSTPDIKQLPEISNTLDVEEESATSWTTPSIKEESTTSWTTPLIKEESTTSWTTPSIKEESTTSWTTPSIKEESTTSWTAPSIKEESTTSWTTPSIKEESTTSWTTPSIKEESTTSWTTPSIKEESTTSRTTPSIKTESTTSWTTPSIKKESTTSWATPSIKKESITSRTTPSIKEESTTSPYVPCPLVPPPLESQTTDIPVSNGNMATTTDTLPDESETVQVPTSKIETLTNQVTKPETVIPTPLNKYPFVINGQAFITYPYYQTDKDRLAFIFHVLSQYRMPQLRINPQPYFIKVPQAKLVEF